METMFSSGAFILLWILGATVLIMWGRLVMNPRHSNRDSRDRQESSVGCQL